MMHFCSPSWVPALPFEPPDTVSIPDFLFEEQFGRSKFTDSKPPFRCGLTGQDYSAWEVKERVDFLARGLAEKLSWSPNEETEWDKVVAIYSVNTIDYTTISWATHRLGGVICPVSAAFGVKELEQQLRSSNAKCLFTCCSLLESGVTAAQAAGIDPKRVYIFDPPASEQNTMMKSREHNTLRDILQVGKTRSALPSLQWEKGEGTRRTAFICYSSGTSGLPVTVSHNRFSIRHSNRIWWADLPKKGVMVSHRNVIANTMQITAYEKPQRVSGRLDSVETVLGILPMSHIYALIVLCHASVYRGDSTIVLPEFDFERSLAAIARFKISILYLVPPIVTLMTKRKHVVHRHDLSSVTDVCTGAAPLGMATAYELRNMFPSWRIRQGYGLTETCTVVSATSGLDIWIGSSGSLLPGCEARLISAEGKDVEDCDRVGELLVRSPSVALGYLNDPIATKETFQNGWLRTGDMAVFRKATSGNQHLFIVDRIKELIKVKGYQVAPAELENQLLSHPAVQDCAVIPVPDDYYGEVPMAFIVRSPATSVFQSDRLLKQHIKQHVRKAKAEHKWIRGGIDFVDRIPRNPSGKILRRVLTEFQKNRRHNSVPRL